MIEILIVLWYFLPAGIANGAPVISNHIPFLKHWKTPLDLGKSFRGKRILGDNKTWRGLLIGILAATLTIWLQQRLWLAIGSSHSVFWFNVASYGKYASGHTYLWLGGLLGTGALLGDAVESFFKRQRGVASGYSWFPYDQIDYIIGALLLSSFITRFTFLGYLSFIAIWTGVHIVTAFLAFKAGLKDRPI